jgi:DNA-binding PadR family transcriptional regulator
LDSSQTGRTVGLPRGLLRFLVLRMLSEKPMSGAEISEQIEKQTGGRWTPSPGSIYPLLAWMLRKGFTEKSPKEDASLKRYTFTAQGKKYLENQIVLGQDFLNKMEFLLPLLIGGIQLGPCKEKLRGVIEPARKLVSTFTTIRHNIEGVSQMDIEEIIQVLTECSTKLERIAQKLGDETKLKPISLTLQK